MKRIILSVLILLLASSKVWSQFRPVEVEFSMGAPFGMAIPKGATRNGGASISLEVRYNLPKLPLSAGLQMFFSNWRFDLPESSKTERYENRVTIATIDYNFDKVHRSLRPFAGLGIGFGEVSRTTAVISVGESDATAYFTPRVGIEAWSRLRFTFAYHVTVRSNSSFVCMLGFVVGGGRK